MEIVNGILYNIDKKDIVNKKLIIPEGVTEILDDITSYNKNIEFLSLPKSLKKIGDNAFCFCENLFFVEIPNSVEEIGEKAFYGCKNLDSIKLSSNLKKLGADAFSGCGIDELIIPKTIENIEPSEASQFFYFDKRPNGIAFTIKENEKSYPIYKLPIAPEYITLNYEKFNKILNDLENPSISQLYNYLNILSKDNISNFVKNHNLTFFKRFQNKFNYNNDGFIKLFYNLGGFMPPIEKNGKIINYSQKVGEFLLLKLEKNEIPLSLLGQIGDDMIESKFKPEFTDFFLTKFDEMLKIEKYNYGFIAKSYNNFEEIQKTNTNNHGSQRQLKPTVQKFYDYLNKNKFENVNDENKHIATAISPFFSNQQTFNNALLINAERIKNKTPNNILSFHLNENSAFKNIDNYQNLIKKLQTEFMNNMGLIANNQFSFDWLEKNDPKNFILGKYCSCCAHLEGAGFGIMRASIIHPRVQNLIIKDKFENIVAKSTLYLNSKYGYGVFNNVEVNNVISDNDRLFIYQKYMEAINAFADEYNKEHPENNLKVITVGMHSNDLMQYFIKFNKRKQKLLPALNYGKYCLEGDGYMGDSDEIQYIVWSAQKNDKADKESDFDNELQK